MNNSKPATLSERRFWQRVGDVVMVVIGFVWLAPLVFAVLAYETWHNRPGSLPVQTGVGHPVVLGQITPGNNYADLIRKTWCP